MEPGETRIIREDHYSHFFNSGKPLLIAKKGTKVIVISIHSHIAIVEDSNKEKFSIHISKL